MQSYNLGLSESNMYLMELYKSHIGIIMQEMCRNERLFCFIKDPKHFDYRMFDEKWWPLFCFSDIGLVAVRYGRESVCRAFQKLNDEDRTKAEYYVSLYSDRQEPLDISDIYHIPEGIENPKV